MKLLILSNYPLDYHSYDRNLTSKIYNEIKKETEVQHIMYVFKGQKSQTIINWFEIEIPFYLNKFYKKIAGLFFIFSNNLKFIKHANDELIMFTMGNSIWDYPMFFYPLLFPKKKFYVETTTPSIRKSKIKRVIVDNLLALTLKPYKNIGMANFECKTVFKIPEKKVVYTQMGFPEYKFTVRSFHNMSLVYLGTLNNRDVCKTVIGLKLFKDKYPNIKISYDIIGGGKEKEVSLLRETIQRESLNEIISYHGYQSTEFVNEMFQKCNVGIAFVPVTAYYDTMFVTKAVEYLLAGMPIIATRTSYMKEIFQKEAGILCDDSSQGFANALEEFYKQREEFDSLEIRELYKKYAMSYIIKNSYLPKLRSLI